MTPLTRFVFPVSELRCRLVEATAIVLAIFSLTLGSAPALADPLLSSGFRSFSAGLGSASLAIGDLNGDGKADLAVTSAGSYSGPNQSGSMSILLGNGNGTFGRRTDIAVTGYPTSLAIADLNLDGKPDLVAATGISVLVLLGKGDGTFGAQSDFESGGAPTDIAIADLNRDGMPDLAVTNIGGYTSEGGVAVLIGNGDGSFEPSTTFGRWRLPNSVTIGDLNGDENPDLAITSGSPSVSENTVSVLLGNGDGTFAPMTDFQTGGSPHSVAIVDLNRDGMADLAVASTGGYYTSPGSVSVLLGNGDGTFRGKTDYGTGGYAVSIADVNLDDTPDLVAANGGGVSVLLGIGDGTFLLQSDFGASGGSVSLAITDLNGDGVPDLIVGSQAGGFAKWQANSVSVLLGNGDGTFGVKTDHVMGLGSRCVAIGDVNGDGKRDLAVANAGASPAYSGTLSVSLGNGDGTFGATRDYVTGLLPRSVALGDMNGDGKPDLAVANALSGTVSILPGIGDGTFGAKTDLAAGRRPVSVAIRDLNDDGKADLVTANYGDACEGGFTVSVWLGKGDGTFAARTDYQTGRNPRQVAIGDLNGDGTPDLVTATSNDLSEDCCGGVCGSDATSASSSYPEPTSFSVLLGHGDGTFAARTDFGTGRTALSVAIGDLNADDRPDLAVAHGNDWGFGRVEVLLGNGDGTFTTKAEFVAGGGVTSVAIGDLNVDGKPDLAVANGSPPNTVRVGLGNGDGTFRMTDMDYGTGVGPAFVAIEDLNGDGKPDALTANQGAGSVSVLLNIGPRHVSVDFDPDVIHVGSNMPWLTAYIEPAGFDPVDIHVATLRVAGLVSALPRFATIGDHDANGIPDLMVKFSREALDPLLQPGVNEFRVTGSLVTGEKLEGGGVVRVTDPPGSASVSLPEPNPAEISLRAVSVPRGPS